MKQILVNELFSRIYVKKFVLSLNAWATLSRIDRCIQISAIALYIHFRHLMLYSFDIWNIDLLTLIANIWIGLGLNVLNVVRSLSSAACTSKSFATAKAANEPNNATDVASMVNCLYMSFSFNRICTHHSNHACGIVDRHSVTPCMGMLYLYLVTMLCGL